VSFRGYIFDYWGTLRACMSENIINWQKNKNYNFETIFLSLLDLCLKQNTKGEKNVVVFLFIYFQANKISS